MRTLGRLAVCALAAAVSGCMVGPDYHRPAQHVPGNWINPSLPPATQNSSTTPRPIDVTQWWKTFNDPVLDGLVDRAVNENLDLKQAESRLRAARATRGVVGSGLLPQVDATGNYSRSGTGNGGSKIVTLPGGGAISNPTSTRQDFYRAGFDAAWELDLFGAVRRNIESADARIQSAVEDRRDVLVTLVAEVATNYVALRGYQRQIAIAQENLAAQQHTADITRLKFGGGFVSRLDVANADAQVYATQSDIPSLQSSAQQAMYSLSLLLAREPEALLRELAMVQPIPLSPPDVPIGVPAGLLARRPDIRRAEANFHAATADIGVATADLYPRITLVGSLDLQAAKLRGLGNWANNVWSIGPSITWPLFAGGRIVANIEIQNALQEQAFLAYKQTVLIALRDVESALVAYAREQERRAVLVQAVAANRQAVDLSLRQYQQGQIDFLNVLNSQRSLYGAETALTFSDIAVATDLAALYKALGGGWQIEPAEGTVAEGGNEAHSTSRPATPAAGGR